MTNPASLASPLLSLASGEVSLETAGGKGANLSRLVTNGFPVPEGFLIPTQLYRQYVHANQLEQSIQHALSVTDFSDPTALETTSQSIRSAFENGHMPAALAQALESGYHWLGAPPVAVRSSATAEDLPDMSFAGQQDTFLNVIGIDPLYQAIIQCWSSLWSGRAIAYRARNHIDQESVALCVVVQKMVAAEASGVLFTANPLTGCRTETVINATMGLGEALVSGQVEPDQYVVEAPHQVILKKTIGAKATLIKSRSGGGTLTERPGENRQQAIPDEVILDLAALGQQVSQLYGFPQDIEWAWASDQLFLLQARPITSLYPLPEGMQPEPLKVLMALSAVQGVFEPLTPLGRDILIEVLTGGGRVFQMEIDPRHQNTFFVAGERLWINFTSVLSNSIGRKILPRVAGAVDPGIAEAFSELVKDARLRPQHPGIRPRTLWRILHFLPPTLWRIGQIWRHPGRKRAEILKMMDQKTAQTQARLASQGDLWTDFSQQMILLREARNLFPEFVIPQGVSAVVAGMIPFFGILARFSSQAAQHLQQPDLAQLHLEIARGLPYNVTTEMDLALWQASQQIRTDPAAVETILQTHASDLAARYLSGDLPASIMTPLQAFMQQYGMRGLGEIDMGRERWREQPEHILNVLQSYLGIQDASQAPDAVFARGARAAEAAAQRLEQVLRATPGGWLKARLVRWGVSRYRALAGLREAPKFFAVRMMGIYRQALLDSGAAMLEAGLLDQSDDLFFLHLDELEEIEQLKEISADLRTRIKERRALRQREMQRKPIPRVLLSDGTAYYEGLPNSQGDAGTLVGAPVSPGVVEGTVRVVLNPNGTQLAPGEILVCPGTDPAWTPLFLAAGGLVMEVGGMMTHGSVVAREYGIPAIVGVHQATTRLHTGQRIRLDGTRGTISILT